jgi:cytochrome c oxidase subunit 2
VGKLWGLFFAIVPIFAIGMFLYYALVLPSGLLPVNVNARPEAYWIDHLFWVILWVTSGVFVLTALAQVLFVFRYGDRGDGRRAVYTHGSHRMEIAWTLVPAVALFALAIYQLDAWASAKTRIPQVPAPGTVVAGGQAEATVPKPPLAEVTGRQFEWRFRYAGPDLVIGTRDDLFTVNELHVPSGEEIVLSIKSEDVLHSFFLPQMRVKQDIVPGMKQFVWLNAVQVDPVADRYDILCTELCGWGHYKMRGRLTVEPRERFDAWFADAFARQELAVFDPAVAATAAETIDADAAPTDP